MGHHNPTYCVQYLETGLAWDIRCEEEQVQVIPLPTLCVCVCVYLSLAWLRVSTTGVSLEVVFKLLKHMLTNTLHVM